MEGVYTTTNVDWIAPVSYATTCTVRQLETPSRSLSTAIVGRSEIGTVEMAEQLKQYCGTQLVHIRTNR
jgi:hypothetical protein